MKTGLFMHGLTPTAEAVSVRGIEGFMHVAPILLIALCAFLSLVTTSLARGGSPSRNMTNKRGSESVWPWLFAFIGLVVAALWQLYELRFRSGSTRLFGGILVSDGLSRVGLFILFLLGVFAVVLGAGRLKLKRRSTTLSHPHAPGLLLLSLSGMSLALLTADLLALVLCLETAVLPLVWLVGENSRDRGTSTRVYLNSLFSAALLLWATVFIQRVFGTVDYEFLAAEMENHTRSPYPAAAILFLAAAFSWKLAAPPFNLGWASMSARTPSPTALLWDGCMKVTLAFSSIRLFVTVFHHPAVSLGPGGWTSLLATIAAVTFIVAGTSVLWQNRMADLASRISLSVAGWILLGLIALGLTHSNEWSSAIGVSYLLIAHGVGLGGILALCSWIEGEDEHRPGDKSGLAPGWKHLGVHHPFLAAAVCVLTADLLGFPLTMGFWARVAILQLFLTTDSSIPLVVVATAGWVVSCLVMIRIVKAMWFPREKSIISILTPESPFIDEPAEEEEYSFAPNDVFSPGTSLSVSGGRLVDTDDPGGRLLKIVAGVAVVVVIVGGIWPEPFLRFLGGF